MLHRTTWIAIPVLGIVLAGSGLGWGYSQYRERQALALQTENQYSASFHELVSHMTDLQEQLESAKITGDRAGFQRHVRDIWRLSYAAQDEVGKLPFDLMPMHQTQHFLSNLGASADGWMASNASVKSGDVLKSVQSYYSQCKQITDELNGLQSDVFDRQLKWSAVSRTLQTGKGDNQIVDGFHKIDSETSAFVEAEEKPSNPVRKSISKSPPGPVINESAARTAVASILDSPVQQQWRVESTDKGAYRPEYTVLGDVSTGSFHAIVSKHGGHVLSFIIEPRNQGRSTVDVADGQVTAQQWLSRHGFGDVTLLHSAQLDGTGFYIYAPLRDGVAVLGQTMSAHVDLSSNRVIALAADNYYDYPVTSVPVRRYSASQLRSRLSPALHVEMNRDVLVLNKQKKYVPAVAFYGTSDGETYCVYLDATDGHELNIDKLS